MAYPVGIGSFDPQSFMIDLSKEEIINFFDQTHQLDNPNDPESLQWREKVIEVLEKNLKNNLKQSEFLDDEVAMGAASVLMNMICAYGKCHFYEYGRGYLDFLNDLSTVVPEFHDFAKFLDRPMFGLAGAIMDGEMFIGYIESDEAKVLLKAFDDNVNAIKEICYNWDENEEMTWSGGLRDALVEAASGKMLVLWYG
jgi:hypothetical protein